MCVLAFFKSKFLTYNSSISNVKLYPGIVPDLTIGIILFSFKKDLTSFAINSLPLSVRILVISKGILFNTLFKILRWVIVHTNSELLIL